MTDAAEPQLFVWEVRPKRQSRKPKAQQLVPRPPGWFAVTNTHGVQGYHLTGIPDAEYARQGSILTLCGITGRRVPNHYPEQIVLCAECVKQQAKGRQGVLK